MRMERFSKAIGLALVTCFLLENGWAQPQEAEPFIEQAIQADEAGRFLEAARAFERAAEICAKFSDSQSSDLLIEQAVNSYLEVEGAQQQAAQSRAAELLEKLAQSQWEANDASKSVHFLYLRCEVLIGLKRYHEAEEACSLAYDRCQKLPSDSLLHYPVTREMASVFDILGRWDQAAALYLKALELAKSRAPSEIPDLQRTLGAVYQLQGRPSLAEDFYLKAIAGFAEQGNSEQWFEASFALALKLQQEERAKEALDIWSELIRKAAPGPRAHDAKIQMALSLSSLKEFAQADQAFIDLRNAVDSAKTKLDIDILRVSLLARWGRIEEAQTLLAQESFLNDLVRADASAEANLRHLAKSYYQRSIQSRQGSDKAKAQNAYAVRLMSWGEHSLAQKILLDSLAEKDSMEEFQQATLEVNLAETYLKLGEGTLALPHFLAALKNYPGDSHPAGLATLLNNASACYHLLGDFDRSISYLERAAELAGTLPGAPPIKASINNALGLRYVEAGRVEEGLVFYRRALAQHRVTGNQSGQRAVLFNMGAAIAKSGKTEAGFPLIEEAFHLSVAASDLELEARIFLFIATHRPRGYEEATLARIEELVPQLQNSSIRSRLVNLRARLELERQQYNKAEELALQTLNSFSPNSRADEVADAQLILFDIALARGDLKSLQNLAPRMLEALEAKLWGLSAREARGLVKNNERFLTRYLEVLLKNRLVAEAFALEEKRRSLGLNALTRDLSLSGQGLDPALIRERESLATLIRSARADGGEVPSNELETLLVRYRSVLDRIERQHLASGAVTKLTSTEVQQVQAALASDEVLIEYLTHSDTVQAIAIDKESIRLLQLGDRSQIEAKAEAAFRSTRRIENLNQIHQNYADLGERLLGPVFAEFPRSSKLVVVPSDGLFSVPFGALRLKDEWLSNRVEVTLAASASSWLLSRKTSSRGDGMLLACLGDYAGSQGLLTPLPGTKKEALQIQSLFPGSRLLQGEGLLEKEVRTQASGKARVHLATHGQFDAEEPLLSSLHFSDREVTAADIFGWNLDADLAVLSACESAGFSRENSYLGLSSAFQFAGARNLVVSYWPVSDQATSVWMESFYAALAKGESPSKAQQRAHLATREAYPHPYFWAAFVVWGDGL